MKRLCVGLLLAFFVSACGSDLMPGSSSDSPANKPDPNKKIESGQNFVFTCVDAFKETTVTLISVWNPSTSMWDITLDENDRQGNKINEIKNLIGEPDKVQSLQMNVIVGDYVYARVLQSGSNQATFYGPGRNVPCSFY